MSKAPIVYFDTSVFIGLIDNVIGRKPIAQNILRYEAHQGSKIHTSILTINEFISRTHDLYHADPSLKTKVGAVVNSIRDIAEIEAFNLEIADEAARLLSVWGRLRIINPSLPRDRKFRWDAIHLATANKLGSRRVYSWDDHWNDMPAGEIPKIVQIISPAVAPATVEQNALFGESPT